MHQLMSLYTLQGRTVEELKTNLNPVIMKTKLTLLFLIVTFITSAQPRGASKMAPILKDGYFINRKGDTVRGQVQVNPPTETDFYSQFMFKMPRSKKLKAMTPKLTKAYGFDDRDFIMTEYDGRKIYIERIVTGRLRLYEYKFIGKVNGYDGVESCYFIKDNYAEGEDADLKELKKISGKFYKRSLKPYMKAQPFIWADLDKYNFRLQAVVNAVTEFNSYYSNSSN